MPAFPGIPVLQHPQGTGENSQVKWGAGSSTWEVMGKHSGHRGEGVGNGETPSGHRGKLPVRRVGNG